MFAHGENELTRKKSSDTSSDTAKEEAKKSGQQSQVVTEFGNPLLEPQKSSEASD